LKLSEESSEGLILLECSKGEVEAISQHLSSSIMILIHFEEAVKEEIERSKFTEENSQNHENHKIRRSYKVDKEGRIHHSGNRSQQGPLISIIGPSGSFHHFEVHKSEVWTKPLVDRIPEMQKEFHV
jgi:hypothetical protein